MIVGFIGDAHGRIFHAMAAAAMWQIANDSDFDFLIQVGDMGAFPDLDRMDKSAKRYFEADPAEADFRRFLSAEGELADAIVRLRNRFSGPIHFIRGNHEDFDWLAELAVADANGLATVDRFDVLKYVPDATILERGGTRFAFLGGAEPARTEGERIDDEALERVAGLPAGSIDVLVTHQGPYGIGKGYYGDTQGSKKMSRLIDELAPPVHIAGHRHEQDGPLEFGTTTYLGVNALVASARWHPEATGLEPGCLAVLDTEDGNVRHVTEPWMAEFEKPFDILAWSDRMLGC